MNKQYLGDSVYAEIKAGMVKLTTENGDPDDPSDVIYLEPEVIDALLRYLAWVKTKLAEDQPGNPS